MTLPRSALTSTRLLKPLSIAVSACILAACSSAPAPKQPSKTTSIPVVQPSSPQTQQQSSSKAPNFENGVLDSGTLDMLEDLLQANDMTMVEGDALSVQRYGDLWDRIRRGYRMGETYNARIEAQKSWFYTRQSYLDRLTARASRYLHHTVAEAERRGIPSELALLPIIESSYDPAATSNAAAAGLWQFIPSTGRIYGLNQNNAYDGRRDVIESTRAAYDFLTSLYNQFGSWELALAAYNAGPGRVSKAIKANESSGLPTDYWSLNLPTETMNYVPRFLAVSQIVNAPSSYGINLPAIANHRHFRTVPVNYGVTLQEVASVTGVPLDELRLLNPALLNLTIDASGPNRIVIPDSVPTQLDAQLSALTGYGFGGEYVATMPAQSVDYVLPKSGAVSNGQSEQELIESNTLPTTAAPQVTANNTIIIQEPEISTEERDWIAAQIQAEAAQKVQVISPTDGNIELDAVQTNQSVLEARGETKTISFDAAAQTAATQQQPAKPHTPPAQTQTKAETKHETGGETKAQAKPNANNGKATTKAKTTKADTKTTAKTNTKTTKTETKKAEQPAKPESYTVRAGDSLTSVAAANGLSVGQLASFNNLASNAHIFVGQKLWLVSGKVKPNQAATQTQAAAKANTAASTTKTQKTTKPAVKTGTGATHKVKAGESLTAVARQYGVTLQALAAENGLSTSDGVLVGQVLHLPAGAKIATAKPEADTKKQTAKPTKSEQKPQNTTKATKPESYTVKSGDNLTSIAAAHGLSIAQLASYNGIEANTPIRAGQKLWLVSGKVKPTDKPQAKATADNKTDTKAQTKKVATSGTHTVKAGENLSVIARHYGVSVQNLAAANNLSTSGTVLVGQVLHLPVGAKATTSTADSKKDTKTQAPAAKTANTNSPNHYTVKAGDSLTSVANRLGVSIADLAAANGISTNAGLRAGQTLKLPSKTSKATKPTKSEQKPQNTTKATGKTTSYTVKSGESLSSIARKYGISAAELAKMNNLKSDASLQLGQQLLVPNK